MTRATLPPPSGVVGHEAIRIVLRLLALVDSSPNPLTKMVILNNEELRELAKRARDVQDRLRVNAERPDLRDLSFCALCGAYHTTSCDPAAGVS